MSQKRLFTAYKANDPAVRANDRTKFESSLLSFAAAFHN